MDLRFGDRAPGRAWIVLVGPAAAGPQALSVKIDIAIVVMLTIVFVHSYRVWKIDPGKREP